MEVREPSARCSRPGTVTESARAVPEWEQCVLGDVAAVSAGGTPSRAVPEFWNGDIPWVTTAEVDFCLINATEQHISRAGLEGSAAKLKPPGTLLIALYGQGKTRGKVAVLGIAAATNQACAAVELDRRVSVRFALHLLQSRYEDIRKLSNTGNQENLSGALVRSIPLSLPPAAEQQAIASALDDTDALIESLEQLLAKKRQLKQGAMQELLTGKRRLPGFARPWVSEPFAKLADIRSGGTPSTTEPRFWDGGIPWCTPTDITALDGRKTLTLTARTISSEGLAASSAELIPAGSIVMTSRATIGECAINAVPVTTNQGFKNFVPFAHTDVGFLYYLLCTQKQRFIALCGGSTFLEIGKAQLRSFEVAVPAECDEQTAIATVLSTLDAELDALETRLTKARALKQGMAQALLTGRIRLAPFRGQASATPPG